MGNNPINLIDPDGEHIEDWYWDALGNVLWQEGSAEKITYQGQESQNIGKTFHEIIDNELFIYGDGKLDLLAVHDLTKSFEILTYSITSKELLFKLGE